MEVFPKVIPTGVDHGTVTVLWSGESFEVTTLRGEGAYTDGRRPDSVFFVKEIEQDLARRDFTVNAIACVPESAELIDPFGGRQDLRSGQIRAVGEALERFQEDGLRVLRAARFCASLEFDLETETEAAISKTLDVFAKVSAERVREEWLKALRSRKPSRAIDAMQRTGILGVTFPELLLLGDTLAKNAQAMDLCEAGECSRLAVLFANVGTQGMTGQPHEVRASHSASVVDGWMRQYRFSNQERRDTCHLLKTVVDANRLTPGDSASFRRFASRAEPEPALAALEMAEAQSKARSDLERAAHWALCQTELQEVLKQRPPLAISDLAVRGGGVIAHVGVPGGAWVKEALAVLLDVVLSDPAKNNEEALFLELDAWHASQNGSSA